MLFDQAPPLKVVRYDGDLKVSLRVFGHAVHVAFVDYVNLDGTEGVRQFLSYYVSNWTRRSLDCVHLCEMLN